MALDQPLSAQLEEAFMHEYARDFSIANLLEKAAQIEENSKSRGPQIKYQLEVVRRLIADTLGEEVSIKDFTAKVLPDIDAGSRIAQLLRKINESSPETSMYTLIGNVRNHEEQDIKEQRLRLRARHKELQRQIFRTADDEGELPAAPPAKSTPPKKWWQFWKKD